MIVRSQGGLHSTGRKEKGENSLKRIWNEYIYQKDKDIEDKQNNDGRPKLLSEYTLQKKTEQVKEFCYLVSEYDYN